MTHTKERGGLTKVGTGIAGFDMVTGGGLPEGRTTLIVGGPGSGKTMFALQTLLAGVSRGEPGIFVTFQESPRHIIENASSCGWNLPDLEKDKLVILDSRIRPNVFKSIGLYFSGMLAGIRVVANELRAKHIVFDSVDALFSLMGERTSERQEVFRLRDWLLESGLTAIITAQVDGNDAPIFHGSLHSAADCVVNFHQLLTGQGPARSLRLVKYRGSGFVERGIPFVIGPSGIEAVASIANTVEASSKNLSILHQEIADNQAVFQDRIRSLTHQLEMKQAELDFLLKEKEKQQSPTRTRQKNPISKQNKDIRKILKIKAPPTIAHKST
ncbi:MAG TPA: ATPase domain-containing protein [Verrucomicrobiae bacterium]|jgi:circadian clock protein KaiC|nr:ATPase domain-containing protein [Verrucomicrobiae bacterium]